MKQYISNSGSKDVQPGLLHPAKMSFSIDGEIGTFQDKPKLRLFMTTKPALQKILKENYTKEEERQSQ